MTSTPLDPQSVGEEFANCATHAAGALLAIVGAALLIPAAVRQTDALGVLSSATYSTCLILLFVASTTYHLVPIRRAPRFKSALQTVDHIAIFLLIAGTYTPFALVALRGVWGWLLFAAIWSLAVLGVGLRIWSGLRFEALRVGIYLLMGWLAVAFAVPFSQSVSTTALVLVALGGLSYTGGLVFYLWHRLPYHHAVWHVFVLLGAILHFCAIFFHVFRA